MTKEELAFKQQEMRERLRSRSSKTPHYSRSDLAVRTAQKRTQTMTGSQCDLRPSPFPVGRISIRKSIPPATKTSVVRNPGQDSFASRSALGVPPVRLDYSTAEIKYACVCGTFSNSAQQCPKCGRHRQHPRISWDTIWACEHDDCLCKSARLEFAASLNGAPRGRNHDRTPARNLAVGDPGKCRIEPQVETSVKQRPERPIPTEEEERAAIKKACGTLSCGTEPTMGGMPSIRRLWGPFRNEAHADIVRRAGGDYLGTKDGRVWFLDAQGSSRTLRIDQLDPQEIGRKLGKN